MTSHIDDSPNQLIPPNYVRIVFERGLEVGESPHSVPLVNLTGSLKEVCTVIWLRFAVRPVVITTRYDSFAVKLRGLAVEDRDSLLSIDGKYLGAEVSAICQCRPLLYAGMPLTQKMLDLQYELAGVTYHCTQLALAYSSACRAMMWISSIKGFGNETHSQFGGQWNAYFEFDGLVSKARRTFDRLGYILWEWYGPGGGSSPRNFADTLPLCTKLPPLLMRSLMDNWDAVGRRLKDYRDCVHHFGTLEFGNASAFMTRLDQDVWSAQLRIPDNPEVKSKHKYRYKGGLDALTYAWEMTNTLVSIVASVVQEIDS